MATWTGIVTGTLMFASPALFARWKWKGVAGATPAFMLWTGVPFFVGCMLYNVAHPTQGVGTAALRALVIVGAILQVLLHAQGCQCYMHLKHPSLDKAIVALSKAALLVLPWKHYPHTWSNAKLCEPDIACDVPVSRVRRRSQYTGTDSIM